MIPPSHQLVFLLLPNVTYIFSELLIELYNISETHNLGPAMQIKIKFAIVSAIFDYNPKISAAIKPEYWEKCMPHVEQLLTMIDENREQVTTGEGIGKYQKYIAGEQYPKRGHSQFYTVCFFDKVP